MLLLVKSYYILIQNFNIANTSKSVKKRINNNIGYCYHLVNVNFNDVRQLKRKELFLGMWVEQVLL